MGERENSVGTKIRRDIPVEDLYSFCSGVAEVADDIIRKSQRIGRASCRERV